MSSTELNIWTIGHSTRTLEEFLQLLAVNEIKTLADVRRFPASRKYPQFKQNALKASLEDASIAYAAIPELGGRRRPRPDSQNTIWQNQSFRGYADYMETDAFREGVARLWEMARQERTAVMCAEAVWWRCHRALIADYLKSRGTAVHHIISLKKTEDHRYTPAARLADGKLRYSPDG